MCRCSHGNVGSAPRDRASGTASEREHTEGDDLTATSPPVAAASLGRHVERRA
jgi:hypothetical protein